MGIGDGTTPGPLSGDAAGAALCEINGLGGGATTGRGAVATVAPTETEGENAAGAGGGGTGAFVKSGRRIPMMVDIESEEGAEPNGAGLGEAPGRAGG
jgi:hypothetical protein